MTSKGPAQEGRATVYARLSLDRSGEGESVDRQVEACLRHCGQQGWQVVGTHEERNVSGYKRVKTPELDAALDEIRTGKANILIVWKLDRLTRRGLSRAGEILGEMERSDARLVSVTENIDTSTAAGEITFGVLAGIAKGESQSISLRVRAANASAAEQGKAHGGPRCFGYNRDGSVNSSEANILHEVASRILAGESLRSLAADLNRRSVKTTLGNDWHPRALGHLLRSPRLRGYRTHNGELYKGNWEPIFSEEDHLRLLEKLGEPSRFSPTKGRRYLLTGFIRCGLCGGRLKYMPYIGAGKSYPRYACVRHPGLPNCGRVAIVMELADATVIKRIGEYLIATRLEDFPVPSDELPKLRALLEEDQRFLNELIRARYFERSIPAEGFEATRRELEARIAATERSIKEAERDSSNPNSLDDLYRMVRGGGGDPNFVFRFMELLGSLLDPAQGRKVIERLIEYVEILPATKRGRNVFDESRVKVHWRRPLPEKVLEAVDSSWQVAEEAAKAGKNPWEAVGATLAEADEAWFAKWVSQDSLNQPPATA